MAAKVGTLDRTGTGGRRCNLLRRLTLSEMERMGFEPTTSCVQGRLLAPASASDRQFMRVFEV